MGKCAPGKVNLGNFRPKFDEAHEEMLVQQIQMMEKSLFGLTTIDVASGV
jgi:hypothetical protein